MNTKRLPAWLIILIALVGLVAVFVLTSRLTVWILKGRQAQTGPFTQGQPIKTVTANEDISPTLMSVSTLTPEAAIPTRVELAETEPAEAAPGLTEVYRWGKGLPSQVTWSVDGKSLAIAAPTGVYIYDTSASFKELQSLKTPFNVQQIAYNPDGTLMAVCCNLENQIELWDTQSWTTIAVSQGYSTYALSVSKISFSPNGHVLAFMEGLGNIILWDYDNDEFLEITKDQQARITSFDFSPDGGLLVTGNQDGSLEQWDVNSCKLQKTFGPYQNAITSVAYQPDGSAIAVGLSELLLFVDPNDGTVLQQFPGQGIVGPMKLSFSPDGLRLLYVGGETGLTLMSVASASFLGLRNYGEGIINLEFSPDGQFVASSDDDGKVYIFQPGQDKPTGTIEHPGRIRAVAISPDGNFIAGAGTNRKIYFLELPTGNLVGTMDFKSSGVIGDLKFSPDGSRLVYLDNVPQIFEPQSFSLIDSINTFEDIGVQSRASDYLPDGDLFALAGADGLIRLGQSDSTHNLSELARFSDQDTIIDLAISLDGTMVASLDRDHTVKIWKRSNGELIQEFMLPTTNGGKIMFTSDNELLALMPIDDKLEIYDSTTGQSRLSVSLDHNFSPALHPQGKLLALGGLGIHILDLETGEFVFESDYDPSAGRISSLAFSQDGQYLASGSEDGTLSLWHFSP